MMINNNGEGKKGTGIKFDQEKLRWDLLPIEPVEKVIKVLMLGSKKYGDYNWQKVPEAKRRYYAAAQRHLTAWWKGEKNDPESGITHLAHAATCLIFLMWHEKVQIQDEFKDNENQQQEVSGHIKEALEDSDNFHSGYKPPIPQFRKADPFKEVLNLIKNYVENEKR